MQYLGLQTRPTDVASQQQLLPAIVNLTDFLNRRHGVGGWTQRTGVGAGTDIGPALVDMCTYLRTNFGRGVIWIPPGEWLMTTTPSAAQWSGMQIWGAGSQASAVVYNSNGGTAFNFSAAGGWTGGGIQGLAITLESGFPASNAVAISLQGDTTQQPDQMTFKDLYITSKNASYWYSGFVAFGNARTSPQGIRIAHLENLQIFRCSNAGMYLSNVVQWTIVNVGIYVGTGGGANFYIAGGGAGATNSTQIDARGIVASEINMTNCSKVFISGTAALVNVATSFMLGDVCFPGASLSGGFGSGVRQYFG